MSAIRLAEILRKHVTEKVAEHHTQMDKGQGTEQYNKLVGRQRQLFEMRGWINDAMAVVDSEEGEDEI